MGPTRSEASAPATGSILFSMPWTVNNWEFQKGFGGSFCAYEFQRNFTAFSDSELRAVARVDMNVFRGEVAGPDARCPAARMQIDDHRNKRGQHFLMRERSSKADIRGRGGKLPYLPARYPRARIRNMTPERPAAAIMRPQLGSAPAKAVFTSGEFAIVRAI